ncbi:MAG: hypothetical protein ACM3H7_01765 [Acidobacteriaceae bacterium]
MAVDQAGWAELVSQHLGWYPLMQVADVYKLLYQGVMGAEHLLSTPGEFIRHLEAEYESLLPDPAGRLLEPVRPDRSMLRLNLRPYKSRRDPLNALFSPLLETAQVSSSDPALLPSVWSAWVASGWKALAPGIEPDRIRTFTGWLEGAGFPSVHHSQVYSLHYQPAYRLITARSALQSGLADAG